MIKIENVDEGYGRKKIIKDVRIEVKEGEIVKIVGEKGEGKKKKMRNIVGKIKKRDGKINFIGEDIKNIKENEVVERGIIIIKEGRKIFKEMKVRENIKMGKYRREEREEKERRMEEVMEMFKRVSESMEKKE